MKVGKLVISVLLFLGFTIPVFAQSYIKDSTELYQYWAHRGIIEMVYAYMEDYEEAVPSMSISDKEGSNNYHEKFIAKIENELPELDTISYFLKNNSWVNAEKILFKQLYTNLKNSANLDSSFFETKRPDLDELITYIPGQTNKRINWDIKCEEILNSYNKQLASLSKAKLEQELIEGTQVYPPVEKEKETQGEVSQSDSIWMQSIIYILIFLAGLLLGAWIVFLVSKQKIYRILHEETNYYLHKLKNNEESFLFNFLGLVHILKQRKDEYKKEKEELLEKNKGLESISKELETIRRQNHLAVKKQQTPLDSTTGDSHTTERPKTHEWEIKPPEKSKLFFSIPESDGRFKNHNGDPVNDVKKFYCIEFEESSEKGDLLYVTSDRDKRAINRLESYLIPVCDIENYDDAESATHITLISPGKVTLINDSWVIDPERKVKIKLD